MAEITPDELVALQAASTLLSVSLFVPLEDLESRLPAATRAALRAPMNHANAERYCLLSQSTRLALEVVRMPSGRRFVRLAEHDRQLLAAGDPSFRKRVHALVPEGTTVSMADLRELYGMVPKWVPGPPMKFAGQVGSEHGKCCRVLARGDVVVQGIKDPKKAYRSGNFSKREPGAPAWKEAGEAIAAGRAKSASPAPWGSSGGNAHAEQTRSGESAGASGQVHFLGAAARLESPAPDRHVYRGDPAADAAYSRGQVHILGAAARMEPDAGDRRVREDSEGGLEVRIDGAGRGPRAREGGDDRRADRQENARRSSWNSDSERSERDVRDWHRERDRDRSREPSRRLSLRGVDPDYVNGHRIAKRYADDDYYVEERRARSPERRSSNGRNGRHSSRRRSTSRDPERRSSNHAGKPRTPTPPPRPPLPPRPPTTTNPPQPAVPQSVSLPRLPPPPPPPSVKPDAATPRDRDPPPAANRTAKPKSEEEEVWVEKRVEIPHGHRSRRGSDQSRHGDREGDVDGGSRKRKERGGGGSDEDESGRSKRHRHDRGDGTGIGRTRGSSSSDGVPDQDEFGEPPDGPAVPQIARSREPPPPPRMRASDWFSSDSEG